MANVGWVRHLSLLILAIVLAACGRPPTPDPIAVASPTADIPRLSAPQAVSLVADRVHGGRQITIARFSVAQYRGGGLWSVTWNAAEWQVDDRSGQVYTVNQLARVLESAQ